MNQIMTTAPANLVPEIPLWRVCDNSDDSAIVTEP